MHFPSEKFTGNGQKPGVNSRRVGIVADDLTSAADGACPFLRQGARPHICRAGEVDRDARVVSVDTGSRGLSEAEAVRAVVRATVALSKRPLLYKTLDSTLRGHARAEILAAFRASGRSQLVVAPAFPAAGRTTLRGVQLLDGTPVALTTYGRDPVHPASTSKVSDLLDVSLGLVSTVPIEHDAAVFHEASGSPRVSVLDADSQATLDRQVASLASTGMSILWVGSPGLAQALAKLEDAAPGQALLPVAVRRVLVVVGSANPVSHEQLDELIMVGAQVVHDVRAISPGAGIVCIAAPSHRQADPLSVLAHLVEQAQIAVQRLGFDAVVATGGDTMNAFLQRMAIPGLVLTGEIEPGFPVGRSDARGGGRCLTLAMKAGGFGDRMSLLRAVSQLKEPGTPWNC